jgi:hypothetical protein
MQGSLVIDEGKFSITGCLTEPVLADTLSVNHQESQGVLPGY